MDKANQYIKQTVRNIKFWSYIPCQDPSLFLFFFLHVRTRGQTSVQTTYNVWPIDQHALAGARAVQRRSDVCHPMKAIAGVICQSTFCSPFILPKSFRKKSMISSIFFSRLEEIQKQVKMWAYSLNKIIFPAKMYIYIYVNYSNSLCA